jgi:hypothetical protein
MSRAATRGLRDRGCSFRIYDQAGAVNLVQKMLEI